MEALSPAPCVLVVEDNPITRQLFRATLTAQRYEVLDAASGREAMDLAASARVDLILQDLHLPDMDGFELLSLLRAESALNGVPIIAASAAGEPHRVLGAGFDAFLLKPIEPKRLVRAVATHLEKRNTPPPPAPRPSTPRVLWAGEPTRDLQDRIAYLGTLGFDVASAKDGAQALARLRESRFDAVLSDIPMEDVDGFQLTRAIRSRPELSSLPVVLLGGDEAGRDRVLGDHAGASAIVSRTTDVRDLAGMILAGLDRSKRPTSVPAARPSSWMPQRRSSLDPEIERRDLLWKSMLSLLGTVAGVASRTASVEHSLGEILASFLDACGFAVGMACLKESDGKLAVRARIGLSEKRAAELLAMWNRTGFLDCVLKGGEPIQVCSALETTGTSYAGGNTTGSHLLTPLLLGEEQVGVLVLASPGIEARTEWVSVAKAVAGPIAQAVAMIRAVARLASSEQRFRGIAESTADAIVVTDASGHVEYANPASERILGSQLASTAQLAHLPPPSGERQAARGVITHPDARQVPVEVFLRSFEDPPGQVHRVYIVHDLSEQERAQELAFRANHDALTKLRNRRSFDEEVVRKLDEARRYGVSGALLAIDLDRFKPINDTHGHQAGDLVLRAVGEVLASSTRQSDIAARLGGDEFAVLLPHANIEQALSCGSKLLARLMALVVAFEGVSLTVGASVGVALFPTHGNTPEALHAAADQALYQAKRSGRGRVCMVGAHSPAA